MQLIDDACKTLLSPLHLQTFSDLINNMKLELIINVENLHILMVSIAD